jgi:hypothetical protein
MGEGPWGKGRRVGLVCLVAAAWKTCLMKCRQPHGTASEYNMLPCLQTHFQKVHPGVEGMFSYSEYIFQTLPS